MSHGEGPSATSLDEVFPWGRCFDEYCEMFALSEDDLKKKILGCGDGPGSFNRTLTERGGKIVSFDPIYEVGEEDLHARIDATFATLIEQVRQNKDTFVWRNLGDVENLGRIRNQAMHDFLEDFERGKAEGRYLAEELPETPFPDKSFDLALCSHFLFHYGEHLSLDFHRASVEEMCRVAKEVRIFPLQELSGAPSPHVPVIRDEFANRGYEVEIREVEYELHPGGNRLLTIR
jgi:hypothetical protein